MMNNSGDGSGTASRYGHGNASGYGWERLCGVGFGRGGGHSSGWSYTGPPYTYGDLAEWGDGTASGAGWGDGNGSGTHDE